MPRERPLMPQPNMKQMVKQVQKMQQDMMDAQEQLKDEEVTASAGGGMVAVKVSGDLVVEEIMTDPDAVAREDVDMLHDMITASVNQAVDQAQQLAASKMGAVTGGLRGGPGRAPRGGGQARARGRSPPG